MSLRNYFLRKKYWIEDFLKGSPMRKNFNEILFIMNNPEKGEKIRQAHLKKILSFARENTVFYSKVKGNNLSDFPIINKHTILSSYQDFIVNENKIPGQKGKVHIQKTSGSTGTPFAVFQDTNCRNRRIATIKAENEIIDFHSFDNMMHLRSLKHYWNFNEDILWKKELCILYADNANLTDERIQKIIDAINKYKIKFIRGYMTTLDTITLYSIEHNYPLQTKPTFISVGELLLESLRTRVISMGCKIISQYGNEENGIFGQSPINSPGSVIKLNRANCFLEILKLNSNEPVNENELGRIVVTDFTNYAMPMIRYEIGDLAMIGEKNSSGVILSIKNLCGRKTDLIYRTNGTPIDLFNSISPQIYNNPLVRQWQFIQNGPKNYILRICSEKKEIQEERMNFTQSLKQILGDDAIVEIEFVNEIPVLNSGKRKIVIQNFKK